MKFNIPIVALAAAQGVLGVLPRQVPEDTVTVPAKIEKITAKNFVELGSKRVKITYGPLVVPGTADEASGGMQAWRDHDAVMPCNECFITGLKTDLQFADGTQANANKGIWLHHTGLMNLNRSDATCPEWPERMGVNGNERSPFDFTVNGKHKAGYYLRKGERIFQTIDVMNMAPTPQTVFLVVEWEYLEGTPNGFDIIFPVWLDTRGGCLQNSYESTGVTPTKIFNSTMGEPGYVVPFDSELVLLVSHIHDGNVGQEVFLNGKPICNSIPAYGETEAFVTHEGMFDDGHGHGHEEEEEEEEEDDHGHGHGPHITGLGHEGHREDDDDPGHDHETSGHTYHVSSITQCTSIGKVAAGSKFLMKSYYNMTEHKAMVGHDGKEEKIMAIEFLHFTRPQDEAIKAIAAMIPGDVQKFSDHVRGLGN